MIERYAVLISDKPHKYTIKNNEMLIIDEGNKNQDNLNLLANQMVLKRPQKKKKKKKKKKHNKIHNRICYPAKFRLLCQIALPDLVTNSWSSGGANQILDSIHYK